MLKGCTVLVGVSGGIAAYKTCELVSKLIKLNVDVHVIMTKNATQFVSPLTFETLSRNRVTTETFDRNFEWNVKHISLAKKADLFVIAPATANVLAKIAAGIADDFLTTTALAVKCPVLAAPAMNTAMLENTATAENIKTLSLRGVKMIYGGEGVLACGDTGSGRMAEPDEILQSIIKMLKPKNDFFGKTVLVTLGGTTEDIDGVRCLTNYSSGKMGANIARSAAARGGKVIVVAGNRTVSLDFKIDKLVNVKSTEEMYNAVLENLPDCDIIIMAAAPCDYTVRDRFNGKIKEQELLLRLEKTKDIAASVGKLKKAAQKLVIFCAETEDLIKNAKLKLKSKNADMVVANNIKTEGAGFGVDTNIVSVIKGASVKDYPKMLKSELADIILDEITELYGG